MFLSRLTTQTIAPCTIRAEVVKVVVKTNNNRDNRFLGGTKITASLMPFKIYINQMVLFLLVAMLLRYRLYDCLFKQA